MSTHSGLSADSEQMEIVGEFKEDQVRSLTPDCILLLKKYLFITRVFEFTRQTDTNQKKSGRIQNFRHHIMGCFLTPEDYTFDLAVKKKENGKPVGIAVYTTCPYSFRESDSFAFNNKKFLDLAYRLLKLMYMNAQCIKLEKSN